MGVVIPVEFYSQLDLLKLKRSKKTVKFDNTCTEHGSNCPNYLQLKLM